MTHRGRPRKWLTNEEIALACRIFLFHAPPLRCRDCQGRCVYGVEGIELRARCLSCGRRYYFDGKYRQWH